jgi:uncharacterized protein YbbC (DUF1343 family)
MNTNQFRFFNFNIPVKVTYYLLLLLFCAQANAQKTGAQQTERYFPLLKGKKLGLVVNPTSVIGSTHLVDTLRKSFDIVRIFAPEHGFRGEAEAGAAIKSGKDPSTGLEVVSLYGKNYKPKPEQLSGIDLVIFDIQDVGCRFYTYLSTLHYVMEACAEKGIPLLLLDRPNPNGHYVDGPILEDSLRSFVGLHPIPIVHGMTLGELAGMINGEKWLSKQVKCKLTVIPCQNWVRTQPYQLPIPPSPNLPNPKSILLYPGLCFMEGTPVSIGRGTPTPFQLYGASWFSGGNIKFRPQRIPGKAENPPMLNQDCRGFSYAHVSEKNLFSRKKIDLIPLIQCYKQYSKTGKKDFFNNFFDKLAGTSALRKDILSGLSEKEIRKKWQAGVTNFKKQRKTYLLYPDLP